MQYIKVISPENSRIVYYIRKETLPELSKANLSDLKLFRFSDFVVDTQDNTILKCRYSLVNVLDEFVKTLDQTYDGAR